MEREIKFKAQRIDNREWVYGYYLSWSHFNGRKFETVHSIRKDSKEWLIDPKTLGQFTGVKDKLEQEVFSGDLLKVRDQRLDIAKYVIKGETLTLDDLYKICVVSFKDGFYCIYDYKAQPIGEEHRFQESSYEGSFRYLTSDIEVVGNIHELESIPQ